MSSEPPFTDYEAAQAAEARTVATDSVPLLGNTRIGNPLYPGQIPCEFVGLDIDGTSGDADLEREMAKVMHELFEIFKKKQASYGPGNIAKGGERGVVLRMSDKLERLWNLVWEGNANPLQDETIEDTFLDIADYGLIALLVKRGMWPKPKWVQ